MSKKNIHPVMHTVVVVLNDKTEIKVMTTCGKENDVMKLDIDPTNHPAWRTDQSTFLNVNNDRVSKFKKKYSGMFGE